MKWECKHGHQWEAIYGSIKKGHWCFECAHISIGESKRLPDGLEQCHAIAEIRGGKCLSDKYTGKNVPMKWECSRGHQWIVPFEHIKYDNTWCPNCLYKNEQECRDIMERLYQKPFPKCRPSFLKGLELDGYNEELKIGFEYDGIQHYQPMSCWGGDDAFRRQKERDFIKQNLCDEHKIGIIRIPYNIIDKEEFINNKKSKIILFFVELFSID